MRSTWLASLLCLTGCSIGTADLPDPPDGGRDAGTVDGGSFPDAGDARDSGLPLDGGADAGALPDSGTPADAGPGDAGPPSHASCSQTPDLKGSTARSAAGNPYSAYVPSSYDPRQAVPLVVALHGAGDTAANYLQFMWRANADARGFIVIAPEGTFAYAGGFAWYGSDDALVVAALDDVQKCYSIDPRRIIVNGFSAGGTMAYFIGLTRAARFSGLAIQSSSLSAGQSVAGANLLPAAWKIPVSHFHGDQDQNFMAADAQNGINRLMTAGHPVFWHLFSGGHTAKAADALAEFDELKLYTSP